MPAPAGGCAGCASAATAWCRTRSVRSVDSLDDAVPFAPLAPARRPARVPGAPPSEQHPCLYPRRAGHPDHVLPDSPATRTEGCPTPAAQRPGRPCPFADQRAGRSSVGPDAEGVGPRFRVLGRKFFSAHRARDTRGRGRRREGGGEGRGGEGRGGQACQGVGPEAEGVGQALGRKEQVPARVLGPRAGGGQGAGLPAMRPIGGSTGTTTTPLHASDTRHTQTLPGSLPGQGRGARPAGTAQSNIHGRPRARSCPGCRPRQRVAGRALGVLSAARQRRVRVLGADRG